MIRNEEKYQQAIEFRKRGFTYSEIAKICDVSKATVSNWLSKKAFSKRVKKDNTLRAARENKKRMSLVNKARRAERVARYAEAARTAEIEFAHYKHTPLFVAGVTLYMSIGDQKNASRIRITSNKPEVHALFIAFLVSYLGVSKSDIQFWLLLTGNMPLQKTMKWWSRKIGLSVARFGKTQYINKTHKPLHSGSGNTIICSTVSKHKLIRWVELLEKEVE